MQDILQRAAKLALHLQALYMLRQIRPSIGLSVTLRYCQNEGTQKDAVFNIVG